MPSRYTYLRIADFRGGRNATQDPLSIGETQVQEARNGDFYRVNLFRKRPGSGTALTIGSAFSGVISSLLRHTPDNDPANAELWGADDASPVVVGAMDGASTFSAVTAEDTPTSGILFRGASANGKLFLAFPSSASRMHVYDPTLSSPTIRRMGLTAPSACTVADTGSGSYGANLRYYRIRDRIKNGSVVVAQSEPSSSTSFTPSGSGTDARVTYVTTNSDQEVTHWAVEGSNDDVTFYELAETAVATTTYDDSEDPTDDYPDNALSPVIGAYTVPTSWKYVLAAFNRLLGLGSHVSGEPQSRLWFTTAKGAASKGDDERVPDTVNLSNWVDLDEGVGGDGTGLAGPIYGAVYIFKYSRILKAVPTGGASPAFDIIDLSLTRGAVSQEAIAVGQDASGQDVIYFLDPQVGPMVMGPTPPTPIGDGVRDHWDNVNLEATNRVAVVEDFPELDQVWFAWATGSADDPDLLAIYDKRKGAWSVCDTGGDIRNARALRLFARTLGSSMSPDLIPYVASTSGNNRLLAADTAPSSSQTSDNSTTFQGLVTTRPIGLPNGKPFRVTEIWIVAQVSDSVTLTITMTTDFGLTTQTGTITLTASGSETRVIKKVEGIDAADARYVEFSIGDSAAAATLWQIEQIFVPIDAEDTNP